MKLPSLRIGLALIPGALILGFSGFAVACQSGLLTGNLEPEAREYAVVVWSIGGVAFVSGATIIILNIIRKKRNGR